MRFSQNINPFYTLWTYSQMATKNGVLIKPKYKEFNACMQRKINFASHYT